MRMPSWNGFGAVTCGHIHIDVKQERFHVSCDLHFARLVVSVAALAALLAGGAFLVGLASLGSAMAMGIGAFVWLVLGNIICSTIYLRRLIDGWAAEGIESCRLKVTEAISRDAGTVECSDDSGRTLSGNKGTEH
jgi:hypothetical protein